MIFKTLSYCELTHVHGLFLLLLLLLQAYLQVELALNGVGAKGSGMLGHLAHVQVPGIEVCHHDRCARPARLQFHSEGQLAVVLPAQVRAEPAEQIQNDLVAAAIGPRPGEHVALHLSELVLDEVPGLEQHVLDSAQAHDVPQVGRQRAEGAEDAQVALPQ